ncbi:RelB/StbD replicon stabilization protein (antitoxin to RelE/StbE) [Bathymodiolus heckerae thiotrophic gill symbiont]|uniref:type II toxin-antitoxin system RelB family antitoxin n=1 Tax=Bathymodiolus heckerae thiotrophic gill symbiont TaxID=1052212 RepID=UPI0010B3A21E|nr:ribbon-helix-helix domain-containing protein [Bathymodiolus heckerae thiotrophic gill symbiont]SMN13496.1 RelB/StbD replicon stabilization protein (antitoxin to RelE/StbE) [Bathymodiolus heckerae thiotrophic gill symbiont]
MLSVRLDKQTQDKLDGLASATKRPKSFFVKEALENYLDDMVDYYEVQSRAKDSNRNFISVEELEKALDV